MAWAQEVPGGARINLTASGMMDRVEGGNLPPAFSDSLAVADLAKRAAYEPALAAFKAAVAERYEVDPACVIPTLGASQAIMHAYFALIRPGDHVIVERPTYEPLHRVPELMGADVSRLERTFDSGWEVLPDRLAKLLTPRTKAVVLSSLHNPSGVAVQTKSLEVIAEMAARVGALVLVDEVYLDYAFDQAGSSGFRPACLAADNTVSWSSTTKAFGFGALRVGWIVTKNAAAAEALTLATHYFQVRMPIGALRMAEAVLRGASDLESWSNSRIVPGRAQVDAWLASEPRVDWVSPTAGATGVIRLPKLMQDKEFAAHLRETYNTQVIPGSFFEAPGMVRLSFAGDPELLSEGLANFSLALDDLL